MKKVALFLGAALLASMALATETAPPDPAPTNTNTSISSSSSNSNSSAFGNASAEQSIGNVSAQGGAGGRGGAGGTSYNALDIANDINFHSKVRSVALPDHSMGAYGSPNGCVGNRIRHRSIFWNGAMSTDSDPVSDEVCALERVIERNTANCQFKTAAYAEVMLMLRLVPGTTRMDWTHIVDRAPNDLSPQQCADRIRPRLIFDARTPAAPTPTQGPVAQVHITNPPPSPAQCVSARAATAKAAPKKQKPTDFCK